MEEGMQISQLVQIVMAVLSGVITLYLVPFLNRKREAAIAERKKLEIEGVESTVNMRGRLVSRLQEFLWGSAAAIAEKRFPQLAEKVKTKGLSKDEIKAELRSWGGTLRSDAMAYFDNQGLDLAKAVGDEFLDKLIERAANAVSPFPGRDTAKELLKTNVSDWIIANGFRWVRAKYLKDELSGEASK